MVEWKNLGVICEIKGRIGFRGYTREDQVEKGEGAISLSPGNIDGGSLNFESCTYITWEKYEESPEIMAFNGDIILGKTASVGKVALIKNLPEKATINPQLVLLKNITINPYYLYYVLSDAPFQKTIKRLAGIGSVPNVSQAKLAQITIPVPSEAEQLNIVNKLDTFTSSIENLKEQIAQRRKQYEYYRDQLLDLEGKEGVKMKNVAHFVKERIPANKLTAQNYTSVENLLKNKAGRKDAENVPSEGNWIKYQKGDVLIGNIRPYLKKIWLSDREGGTNGDVIIIRANDVLIPKFMFYCLASDSFFLYYNQALKDGKMPRGEKNRVLSYVIPFFVKEKQASIVSILDTFEASIQNLEAQLAEREKQYEYYRNKLLTFE